LSIRTGRRSGVTEKQYDPASDTIRETRIDWLYDNLGRLTRESYNAPGTAEDFIADYVLDLVGNRVAKKTDPDPTFSGDPTYNETIDYVYDANDRLLLEKLDGNADATVDQTTAYSYGPNADLSDPQDLYGGDGTEQTTKTLWDGDNTDPDTGTKVRETFYGYNLQGRLAAVEEDTDGDGTAQDPDLEEGSYYTYNDEGVRVGVVEKTDGNDDGDLLDPEDSTTATDYLVDANNPTGYAQVIEEHDGATDELERSYTLGHDVLVQWDATTGLVYLLYDGHGSTRALLDAAGQVINAATAQVFRYDAFGVRLDAATALTSLLYSGEQTDATDLQYLRARYYDPATGRFNRLDPFAGNVDDPLSLHKYLYCHADGVNAVDPSGELGFLLTVGIGAANGLYCGALMGAINGLFGYFSGQMTSEEAWGSFGKWTLAGLIAGVGCGAGGYLGACLYGFLGTAARWAFMTAMLGAGGGGVLCAGGADALLTGMNQSYSGRSGWAELLQDDIKVAAKTHGMPAELVASVLMAELLDYNVTDWLFDDLVLYKPEAHSMGLAQLRIDNMRKWGIRGWNKKTPASEIRTALMDERESVDILAEVLRYFYDNGTGTARERARQYWYSSDDIKKADIVALFCGAKDKGVLDYSGELAALAEKAYGLVHASGVYADGD